MKRLETLMVILCFTPTYFWYVGRIKQGGEDAVALLLLPLCLLAARQQRRPVRALSWGTVLGVLLYVISWLLGVPALLKAVIAVGVLMFHFQQHRNWSVLSLALLSLPWLSSLQFFLGYPLRILVAQLTAYALQFSGLPVSTSGTGISLDNVHVFVDPPCSGVKMLWAGFVLCAFMLHLFKTSFLKSGAIFLATSIAVILANVVRGGILFFPESGLVQWPEWAHSAVGLVIYGGFCVLLVAFTHVITTSHAFKNSTHHVITL